ncbi:hypothetical protein RJ639_025971, partial [Escallonia herrerae]
DQAVISLTKENEKDLLITLSQELVGEEPFGVGTSCVGSEDHNCFTEVIGYLMPLLAVKSQYIQHVAGNLLVVISKFAARFGSYWNEFLRSLCLYLELSLCNSLSSSLESQIKLKSLDCDPSVIASKLLLKNVNWSSVAGIVRVLRTVLKNLKQEFDDQLFIVYLDSVSSCLSNLPLDSLNEVHVGENGVSLRSSSGNALIETAYNGQLKLYFAFCGSLIQLFCSLVAQIGSSEAAVASLDKHPAIHEICSIIPKVLACWCGPEGICSNTCIAPYFRHKILMLMIRLSFQLQLNRTTLSSWLNLIHKYFQDLLLEPITQIEPDQDDCLEGSPFLVGCSGEKKSFSSRHLQRLAVFLFLRCSFRLINLRERTEEQYGCANMKSCLVLDLNWAPEVSREKILFDLFEWLRRHLPANILVDQEKFSERCTSFALSFLQLYMKEDDMLFEVLLQLFSLPFCSELEIHRGEKTSQEAEDDKLFLASSLFSPIRLLHLFLAELIYDHQVLLDYLISKDTGASCAEYLLRCLRTVCESWNLFAECSLDSNIVNRSSCKKRKLNAHSRGEPSSADVQGSTIVVSVENECEQHIYGSKHLRTNRLPFEDAVKCLLSLKKSVENLHQKNLFPYNPDVLLRRCVFCCIFSLSLFLHFPI